jgi:hypothetical protein
MLRITHDFTISETSGDVWSCEFTGNNIKVITPKETDAGKIEIQIDGQTLTIVDLSVVGERKPQQGCVLLQMCKTRAV